MPVDTKLHACSSSGFLLILDFGAYPSPELVRCGVLGQPLVLSTNGNKAMLKPSARPLVKVGAGLQKTCKSMMWLGMVADLHRDGSGVAG